ncbi:MAG: tetratricopeptide repeat protein [Treponema sp.]|jgi:tetratricopeptide (TPR) repeat protein|nr:tetratricopeptide repeat protein [Treponema sp.]
MQLKIKEALKGVFIVLVIVVGIWVFFRYQQGRAHRDLAKKIAELSPRGGLPETIEGLRTAIAAYEEQIELNVKEGAQTGVYWKILATRLADKGMHRDALDALERAIYFDGEEPTLFYLTGISAAVTAKSSLDFPGSGNGEEARNRYFALAESAHLRAIELDPGYSRPRYAIGILYVFELNRPAEAIPHLRRYLELMSTDTDAMFALARAYYMTGSAQNAADMYDRIMDTTRDKTKREEAQRNKEFVMGQNYG